MKFEVFMRFFLTFVLIMITGAVLADPPMKTVYSDSSTTKFTWTWPYHTVQKKTYFQDFPYPLGSSYQTSGYGIYRNPEDVSQYRFHNSHLTYKNQWGYFFPDGTRPVKTSTGALFVSPQGYYMQAK
jgi:hypothetical protein